MEVSWGQQHVGFPGGQFPPAMDWAKQGFEWTYELTTAF